MSAQPCFHGLQRPQAEDLRALNLRWVSLVFTDDLNAAVCGSALFFGHAAFVVWPQVDDLRALILRWVSLVFTGVLSDAVCGAALFLGHAAFVVWPQVPPPFGRGYQGVFAFVGQGKCQE